MSSRPDATVRHLTRLARCLGVGAGLLMPALAWAELSSESLLGLGVRFEPAYDGSATQRAQVIPILRVSADPWYARTTQDAIEGGVRTELLPRLHAGLQLAYEPGRKANEAAFLSQHHVPDDPRGVSVGAHLEWDHDFGPAPTNWLLRVRQHIGSQEGTQVDLRLAAGVLRVGRLSAGVWAGATWSDATATGNVYGISGQESVTTGLPAFHAVGGWLYSIYGVGGGYELSRHWIAGASLESHGLLDDAVRSPLVQRAQNYYLTFGLAYRF